MKKKKALTATERVAAHRARVTASGGKQIAVMLSPLAAAKLDAEQRRRGETATRIVNRLLCRLHVKPFKLIRVVAPHFVAGLEYDEVEDRIVQAAPILRYAVGWNRKTFREYVARKGWRAHVVSARAAVGSGVAVVAMQSEALTMNHPTPNNPQSDPNEPGAPIPPPNPGTFPPAEPNPNRGPGGTPHDPSRRPDDEDEDANDPNRPSRRGA